MIYLTTRTRHKDAKIPALYPIAVNCNVIKEIKESDMSLDERLTPQELNERIAGIQNRQYDKQITIAEAITQTKQLIRDCIEAVTPNKRYAKDRPVELEIGYNRAIDVIQANTKELLGDPE